MTVILHKGFEVSKIQFRLSLFQLLLFPVYLLTVTFISRSFSWLSFRLIFDAKLDTFFNDFICFTVWSHSFPFYLTIMLSPNSTFLICLLQE